MSTDRRIKIKSSMASSVASQLIPAGDSASIPFVVGARILVEAIIVEQVKREGSWSPQELLYTLGTRAPEAIFEARAMNGFVEDWELTKAGRAVLGVAFAEARDSIHRMRR